MTERDAFGNPIEDAQTTSQPLTSGDPLISSDPLTSGDPLTSSDAMGASKPTPAPAPTAPRRRRRRRRLLGLGGLIGLLLFFAPLIIGGWFVYQAVDSAVSPAVDVINDVRDTVREQAKTATDAATDRKTPDRPPRGLQRGSLLRPAAFDALLRKVRADPGGKLLLLRLAPERADLQLSRPGGGMSIVQLRFDGGRSLVRTSAGASASKAITFSKIDRDAPARLVRSAARRLGRKTTSIDYLVLLNILDGPRWSAYFKGGAAFQGDAHGKIARRIQ